MIRKAILQINAQGAGQYVRCAQLVIFGSSAWKKLRQGSMEFCVTEWMYRYPSNHFKGLCVRRVTQSLHVDVLNLLRMWRKDHGFRKKFSDQPPEKINQLNFFGPRIKAQRFPFPCLTFARVDQTQLLGESVICDPEPQ